MTVLVHSLSDTVLDVFRHVTERGVKINVITTEGHPSNTGHDVAEKCEQIGLPCQVIVDSGVAVIMHKIDFVCIGCEAVMANGGIVNKIGTFGLALIAQHF